MSDYDSTNDTQEHITQVRFFLAEIRRELEGNGWAHDESKLQEPEKSLFDKYTPLLRGTVYGSDEYKQYLQEMGAALEHHYAYNSHHPEHFENGIDGMNLIQLVEMFCDWKAASLRHATGSMAGSLEINALRFFISPQLLSIFKNTVELMKW